MATLLSAVLVCVCVLGAFAEFYPLPKTFKLLGKYVEGSFVGLVWEEDRCTRILGLTLIGEVTNEPAFSDESNPLTQALRLLRHVVSLNPQRLVIHWQLQLLEEMPEALILKSLRKLSLRRCLLALVIDENAERAAASKLLTFCEIKKSVPQAIEWLVQMERPKSGKPGNGFPRWAPIVAVLIFIVTFLFFIALAAASLFHHSLPPTDRFPAMVVLAIGVAVSSGLISGRASVIGPLPIPFPPKSTPVQISVIGGVATLIVLLILGKILYG